MIWYTFISKNGINYEFFDMNYLKCSNNFAVDCKWNRNKNKTRNNFRSNGNSRVRFVLKPFLIYQNYTMEKIIQIYSVVGEKNTNIHTQIHIYPLKIKYFLKWDKKYLQLQYFSFKKKYGNDYFYSRRDFKYKIF